MARRISTGVTGEVPIIGTLNISGNTISTTETNSNLTLDPNGSGTLVISAITGITGNTTVTGTFGVTGETTITGDLVIANQGDLRLRETTANGTNYVALQAPSAVGTDYTLTLPTGVPSTNGQALVSTTGGVTSWQTFAVALTYSTVSSSFAAAANNAYFVVTSGGGVTATLPASPSVGDTIRFFDAAKTFDSNTFTVARNGKLIQGDAADMTVTTESAAFELVFSGDTYGWRIFSI